MNNEFETKKFNLDEISKGVAERDFSYNPTGEKYKHNIENRNNEKNKSTDKKIADKKIVLISVLTVMAIAVVAIFAVNLFSSDDKFYKSSPKEEVANPSLESDDETAKEKEEEKPTEPQDRKEEKVVCPYKGSVGNYIMTSSSDVGEMSYNVYISNISDDGDIIFSVALMNTDVSVMYETGSIKGTLDDNKLDFNWKDNHGNSGTGELKLFENAVSIMLNQQETSENNTASLDTGTPLTIAKIN